MPSRISIAVLLALFVAVLGRDLRVERSPQPVAVPDESASDETSWADSIKGAFQKAKEGVSDAVTNVKDSDAVKGIKDGFSKAGDKLSEIGHNIKNSDAYEKVSSELHNAGEKLSKGAGDLADSTSNAFEGAKKKLGDAAETLKDKLDD